MLVQSDNTQRQIILNLRRNGPLSVAQLSRLLKITEMAVRRHLSVLEREGLINADIHRLPMGRPTRAYRLTESADEFFPKSYCQLALDILADLTVVNGRSRVDAFFADRSRRLAETYRLHLAGKSLEEQLKQMANLRDKEGFLPTFSPLASGGFRFSEHNCPFTKVAQDFPEACAQELNLFRLLFGGRVSRETCLATGGSACSYIIAPVAPQTDERSG